MTRLLPDIDLARIAPLPDAEKRQELEMFKLGSPSITYNRCVRITRISSMSGQKCSTGPIRPNFRSSKAR